MIKSHILTRLWQRYLVATAIVAAATGLRLLAMQSFGMRAPYITFFPAVMLAALFGGIHAGILATGLAGLVAAYLWIEPAGRLAIGDPADMVGMAVFLGSCTVISIVTESMHRAQARAGAAELQVGFAAEREQSVAAVRESERRLRRAEEMAHLGHWRLDLKSGHITWSDEMYRIFGLDRDDPAHTPTMDDIRTLCHPADLEVCIRSFEPFEQETGNAMEFRIRRPNGDERHVVSNGELQRDEHGAAVAVFGTLLDMSDLRLKERELQEKNTELERFTYMISHDLKSPLITVRTFLGYLEQDLADSEYGRIGKDLHYIRTAADRMSRMLDDLLEMSRIGRMVNAAQDCTFRELVDAARDMVAGRIAERGVEVLVGDGDVALYGDRQRLVEIWQNLLENACKFMGDQAHPRIEVGAEGRGRDTVFFVRDNGMGIEPQYHEKIFGLFEKLDKDVEGTGLGLALVRRIVELNGGKIWIESQGSGQGACFRFTLPEASRVT